MVPLGVTVEGDNLKLMGQDPQNKANIYDITGKEFAAVLKGDASDPIAEFTVRCATRSTHRPANIAFTSRSSTPVSLARRLSNRSYW